MILGGVFLTSSIFFIVITKLQLKKFQQNSKHESSPTKLVTSGVFKISRNPIYLGIVGIQFSPALILNSSAILLGTLSLICLIYFILIKKEEVELTKVFQDSYLNYKKEVRRWL